MRLGTVLLQYLHQSDDLKSPTICFIEPRSRNTFLFGVISRLAFAPFPYLSPVFRVSFVGPARRARCDLFKKKFLFAD
jgi:hypothetical protein